METNKLQLEPVLIRQYDLKYAYLREGPVA